MVNIELLSDEIISENTQDATAILGTLSTVIAAHLEREKSSAIRSQSGYEGASEAWEESDSYWKVLIDEDPEKAINLAVTLLNMEGRRDEVGVWIQAGGLSLLGMSGLQEQFRQLLDSDDEASPHLVDKLKGCMSGDLSNFTSLENFDHPRGFSTLQAIYVGLRLKNVDIPRAKELFQSAKDAVKRPDIVPATRILSSIEGCSYLKRIVDEAK